MGMTRNRLAVQRQIAMHITRIEEAPIALYRKVVWEIFTRIVAQTPQFTGRAVANWNLSINSPDLSWDANMGEDIEFTASGYVKKGSGRDRGDPKWAQEATERARYILRRIKRGDKVWITNAVRGDTDSGQSSEAYLKDLQDPGYWMKKLRAANKPYETAMESAMHVAESYLTTGTLPLGSLDEGP